MTINSETILGQLCVCVCASLFDQHGKSPVTHQYSFPVIVIIFFVNVALQTSNAALGLRVILQAMSVVFSVGSYAEQLETIASF